MDKEQGYVEFINSDSYKTHLDLWYKVHNITREKTELYCDFLITLLEFIEDTYLGDDVIKKEDDIISHFTWCFNQTISLFEKERIYFKQRGNHYEFFKLFFIGAFYNSTNPNAGQVIREYFEILFGYQAKKAQIDIDMFTEMYHFLDQNLKK